MISAIVKKGYYTILTKCHNANSAEVILDTGAFVSCFTLDDMVSLTGYRCSYFLRLLNGSVSMSIKGMTSNSSAVHVCLRNCNVGGEELKLFHCLLTECNISVLGMDVILAGKLFGDGEVGGIANFDYSKYLANVQRAYISPVYEINALSQGLTFKDYCEFNGITGSGIADEARRLENLFGWSSVYEHLNDLFNEFPWKR